jgi:hypothetical protein
MGDQMNTTPTVLGDPGFREGHGLGTVAWRHTSCNNLNEPNSDDEATWEILNEQSEQHRFDEYNRVKQYALEQQQQQQQQQQEKLENLEKQQQQQKVLNDKFSNKPANISGGKSRRVFRKKTKTTRRRNKKSNRSRSHHRHHRHHHHHHHHRHHHHHHHHHHHRRTSHVAKQT